MPVHALTLKGIIPMLPYNLISSLASLQESRVLEELDSNSNLPFQHLLTLTLEEIIP